MTIVNENKLDINIKSASIYVADLYDLKMYTEKNSKLMKKKKLKTLIQYESNKITEIKSERMKFVLNLVKSQPNLFFISQLGDYNLEIDLDSIQNDSWYW